MQNGDDIEYYSWVFKLKNDITELNNKNQHKFSSTVKDIYYSFKVKSLNSHIFTFICKKIIKKKT